ncbi:hypothetical protein [uncultured Selenomonas sp.]|uniref:hypothetical protein n=1 Tax=uncultured Selenomonas sp. TaxID=159275 RepID=UPI0028ECBACB|nr:hypothetical protein [uncultured Selenomonas sp.]
MRKDIIQCIEAFYGKPNHGRFMQLCRKNLRFKKEFYDLLNSSVAYSDSLEDGMSSVVRAFCVTFHEKKRGDFHIQYDAQLFICKLIPVVTIRYGFNVIVPKEGKKYACYELSGVSSNPYCKEQKDFHERATNYFSKEGYRMIYDSEAEEYAVGVGWFNSIIPNKKYGCVGEFLFTDFLYDWEAHEDTDE